MTQPDLVLHTVDIYTYSVENLVRDVAHGMLGVRWHRHWLTEISGLGLDEKGFHDGSLEKSGID